jgi:hypothetical protein
VLTQFCELRFAPPTSSNTATNSHIEHCSAFARRISTDRLGIFTPRSRLLNEGLVRFATVGKLLLSQTAGRPQHAQMGAEDVAFRAAY